MARNRGQSPRDRVRIGSKDNPLPFLVGKTFKCRVDLVEIAHGCLTTTGTHVYRRGVSFYVLLDLFQWLVKAGSHESNAPLTEAWRGTLAWLYRLADYFCYGLLIFRNNDFIAGSQPMDKILQIRLGFFNRDRY